MISERVVDGDFIDDEALGGKNFVKDFGSPTALVCRDHIRSSFTSLSRHSRTDPGGPDGR